MLFQEKGVLEQPFDFIILLIFMNTTIYFISAVLLILLVLVLLAATLYALWSVLEKNASNLQRRKKMLFYVGLGFCCWLAFLALMANIGFFNDFQSIPPTIMVAVAPPIALTIVLLFSKKFAKVLNQIPEHWLIYIQAFRIPMELLLWLGYIGGFVPFQMTFEGLNYDILVGITAILAGFVFFGRGRYRHFEAIIWNISGITLLLNIFMLAVLSTPSPFRVFLNEPANVFVAQFPYIWIPGFIVPFALAIHLFSIKQLIMKGPKSQRRFLAGKNRFSKNEQLQ